MTITAARQDLRDQLTAAILRMEMTTQEPGPLPDMLAAILPAARRACTPVLASYAVAELLAELPAINAAGNPILSAWRTDAAATLARWKLAELTHATRALLAEHAAMNADLRKLGKGRTDADDRAHPDAPAVAAADALAMIGG